MAGYSVWKAAEFVAAPHETIVNQLSTRLIEHYRGDHERQLWSWRKQVRILQDALRESAAALRRTSGGLNAGKRVVFACST